jgi:hypothetical protein
VGRISPEPKNYFYREQVSGNPVANEFFMRPVNWSGIF